MHLPLENSFIHHCPGSLWKFFCWSVTQLYPDPKTMLKALNNILSHSSYCPSWEVPLVAYMFLANNFLSFWHYPEPSGWHFILPEMKEQEWVQFSLPYPFLFAQTCELFGEESFRHVSQALSIRLIDKQAGPWHWTVSFVDATILRMKARESESLWLMVCSFLKNALWFLTEKGRNSDKTREGRICYFLPPANSLVPVAKNITLIYKTNINLIIYHLKFNSE